MEAEIRERRRASMPVVTELVEIGLNINWISDLYSKKLDYKSAIPILIKWLPLVDDVGAKESIVRALSVSWAKPMAALPLIHEFQRTKQESIGLKWAIANALSVVADDSVYKEIVALVQERKHGKAREMLALSLANMKNPQAISILINLLEDETVSGHAIMALGKLRAEKAQPAIERFLIHPKAWIRKEAKKALLRIDEPNENV